MAAGISVVVPSYNPRREDLERLYRSLVSQTYGDFEVIIVDDGSDDSSYDLLDDPRFRVIRRERNSGPAACRNAGAAAMYAWGFRNPLGALQDLGTVENTELQAFWASRLLAGWAHGEYRDSASEYIAKLPDGTTRLKFLATLAWEISKEGPKAVIRWAEGVPDDPPHFKQAVFMKAASTLAGVDAASTARWLQGHLDRDYVDNALLSVARSWAASDAPAAMSWLTGLPASKKREAAVRTGYGAWFSRSPTDAEDWLRSASPAPAVDPAVRFMVERTRDENPELSSEWEALIADEP